MSGGAFLPSSLVAPVLFAALATQKLKQCPAGSSCKYSTSTSDACRGSPCGTFSGCGAGGSCICVAATEGTGFCPDGQTLYSGLADCADSSAGFVCAF